MLGLYGFPAPTDLLAFYDEFFWKCVCVWYFGACYTLVPHPLEADKTGNEQTHFWEVVSSVAFRQLLSFGFFFPNGSNRNSLEENLIADVQHSRTCFWSSCSAHHRCGESSSFIWVGAELLPLGQFQGFTAMGLYGFHLCGVSKCWRSVLHLCIYWESCRDWPGCFMTSVNAVAFASFGCPAVSLWPTTQNQF